MARGTPGNLSLGPGYLYIAPLGTTEPTDLVTAWATVSAAWVLLGYCADEETEILTRRGWLRQHQVTDADECLGISADDGLARWQPVEAVHRFPAMPREMIAMTGQSHSSLTTPNHRWLVDRRRVDLATGRKGGRSGLIFTTTDRFHTVDHVPCAAPVTNLPTEPKYADALVELVAWWMTEGSEFRNGGGLSIYQSETANPQHCASIRAALTALFGPARQSMATDTPQRPDKAQHGRVMEPAWREGVNKGCAVFHLNKPAASVVREHAPGKIIRPEFITALTLAQLRLLLDTAIKGDGWHRVAIGQRDRDRLSPLQMAASLAGLRTSLRNNPNRGQDNWVLRILQETSFTARRGTTRIPVIHTGMIWCPSTPTHTWLARRDGHVFFTGNTDAGSTFNYQLNTDQVEVAEELDPISNTPTGRTASVQFALAEITATNLKRASNGGTITTGTGIVTFEPPDLGTEVRTMLGFESEDHTERWLFRQCFMSGQLQVQRQKGAAKATFACEFTLEKPVSGSRLYKAIFAAPQRQ